MENSSPPTPELPERKNRLSSNSGIKRSKVSRACDECRKRKVRCDGAQPCSRCQKSITECIFSNVVPKRGPPKKYLEPFEDRLKTVDIVLRFLELQYNGDTDRRESYKVDSTIEKKALIDVTSTGRALYINDNSLRVDRIEPIYDINLNYELSLPDINHTSTIMRPDLIQSYFDHIHPSIPFIHRQSLSQSQPSIFLLNAIYAVASRFIPQQSNSNDPPGWYFYKLATDMIDSFVDAPRLSTIQALVLLAKYHESISRPGFFSRTKCFIQLAVKMSGMLGLSKEIPQNYLSGSHHRELEVRRRVFWVVYTYQVLLSAEQGSELYYSAKECTTHYPNTLSDESSHDAELLQSFHWLSRITHTLAMVIEFIRLKHSNRENSHRQFNEAEEFETIEKSLSYLGANIPQLNQEKIHTTFTHLVYHLTTILLYRPYSSINKSNQIQDKNATSRCVSSAINISQIVDHILTKYGIDAFQFCIRGNQQIIYCLTASITILRTLNSESSHHLQEHVYEKALSILQSLVHRSPVVELLSSNNHSYESAPSISTIDRTEFQTVSPSNTSSTRSSPLMSHSTRHISHSPTIRKRHSRSSLQFPVSDNKNNSSTNLDMAGHRVRSNTNRSQYANNRLSAPALGSLFEKSPYFYQLQGMQYQLQSTNNPVQQQMSSYSQPSSPTISQFTGNEQPQNTGMVASYPVAPRRTTSLSRKTGLRRSASSTGEFIIPTQRAPRSSTQPYINPRRHTLTSTTPPDLSSIVVASLPPTDPNMMEANLHTMAMRNSNRYSAPVMSNNTQQPYMIPITLQQQQRQLQQLQPQEQLQQLQQQQFHFQQQHQNYQNQTIIMDPSSFPMDPVIPDAPSESMMGLLLNNTWNFMQPQ